MTDRKKEVRKVTNKRNKINITTTRCGIKAENTKTTFQERKRKFHTFPNSERTL